MKLIPLYVNLILINFVLSSPYKSKSRKTWNWNIISELDIVPQQKRGAVSEIRTQTQENTNTSSYGRVLANTRKHNKHQQLWLSSSEHKQTQYELAVMAEF
jgi:hypothetical protein